MHKNNCIKYINMSKRLRNYKKILTFNKENDNVTITTNNVSRNNIIIKLKISRYISADFTKYYIGVAC